MLKRNISLSRNPVLLQMLVILPIIFAIGIIAYLIYYLGFNIIAKIFLSIMFVFELAIGFKIYSENNKFLQFSDHEIVEYKSIKNNSKILNIYKIDAVKNIVCNDNKKEIKFLYHNCPDKNFLKFKYINLLNEEVYFKVKSELCRYYPTKTISLRDESIEKYIETEKLPEYIETKIFAQRCQAIIIIFFEFLLALIPIGMTVISLLWSCAILAILIRKEVLILLNFFY